MTPQDREKIQRAMVAHRRPEDPADEIEQDWYIVRLPPITSESERYERWHAPQQWCRDQIDHAAGHRWARRIEGKDRGVRQPVFGFSDEAEAVVFKLRFY